MKRVWLVFVVVIAGLVSSAAMAAGVTITIACGAVGQELTLCKQEADAWAQQTGNTVNVLSTINSTTDRLALYQQQLGAKSDAVDVYQIDVVYPGILGSYFIDLSKYFSKDELSQFIPAYVKNDQYQGKQIAIPWFADAGVLYYRKDLLAKYGYSAPPKTWDELTTMAQKIQAGERAAGNSKFWGFVWQGNSYEGLTCDALEWVYSYNGGTIVDSNGNITIDNPKAAAAINMAKSWVGTISPPGVLSYQEEEARGVWQAGNAAFMRNWPYAYGLGQSDKSPIKGKFDIAVLPKASAADGQNAGTLGGWQLAVSRFSKHPAEAASLIKYLTSVNVEIERAVKGTYEPSRPALYTNATVDAAYPFFARLQPVFANAVARPSTITGSKYNQVSSAFWTAVHSVLSGQQQANQALAALKGQLTRIKGAGW